MGCTARAQARADFKKKFALGIRQKARQKCRAALSFKNIKCNAHERALFPAESFARLRMSNRMLWPELGRNSTWAHEQAKMLEIEKPCSLDPERASRFRVRFPVFAK